MENLRIAILVSGQGSVLKTVLRVCEDGTVAGTVAAVASNRECPGLNVARSARVPFIGAYPLADFGSRPERDAAMGAALKGAGVNLVIVGGYNDTLEQSFFDSVSADVIGMYPALLPAFAELPEAIGPALEYGVKTIGVTIHYRTPLTGSSGPIIAQEPLPVDEGDTVEGVTKRVIELESELLPRVLKAFAEGRVLRSGPRVRVLPGAD